MVLQFLTIILEIAKYHECKLSGHGETNFYNDSDSGSESNQKKQ